MRTELLGQGIAAARIHLDEASLDTLQSVVAVARFVLGQGLDGAVICSDRYHIPRIRLLLAVLGVRTAAGPTASGLQGTRRYYWIKMHLREALAIPYDLAIVIARRPHFMRLTRLNVTRAVREAERSDLIEEHQPPMNQGAQPRA